jgi:SAM-dependent methyltransferase
MIAHSHSEFSARDFVEWDTRNWSVALDFWLENSRQRLSGCTALEIGSRHGGLSLWLALQGARVVCSDVHGPSKAAVSRHRASRVAHLIEHRTVDVTDIPYSDEFDLVVFKSVLGGISVFDDRDLQATAVRQMHKALKKGGELFFAENLVASPVHTALRRRYVRWGAKWRYVSVGDMEDFLAIFSRVRLRTIGSAAVFGKTEAQKAWLGLADRLLLERLTPSKWRYIVAGVATK